MQSGILGASPLPSKAFHAGRRQPRRVVTQIRAQEENAPSNSQPPRRRRRRSRQPREPQPEGFSLEDLNPISMGRKSRVIFDDVWAQLQRIGGPSRSVAPESVPYEFDVPEVYESPRAPDTTVLVTGATGRTGRILVRKLLLRGYKVRALVRRRGENDPVQSDAIPQSVEVIYGDIADYKACRAAVAGVDKVICCSAARTTLTADLNRVDNNGVATLARAFLDEKNASARKSGSLPPSAKVNIADFGNEAYHPLWDIEHVGVPEEQLAKTGYYAQNRRRNMDKARDLAEAYIDEQDCLVFEGAVYSRDGYAQVGASLEQLPHSSSFAGTEGLILRVLGDDHQYNVIVKTADDASYYAKFNAILGFSTIRLPWNTFVRGRGSETGSVVVDPATIAHLSIRFEPKTKILDQVTQPGQSMFDSAANRFKLAVDWIKALPGGEETDFVLVSCAGARREDQTDGERDRVVAAKRAGEASLRNSGLGYTIIRPGPLVEEAGGYKALVFDQGNRITEKVACADVADICLKALHDGLARNKTFEVCWEYTPEAGLESWDLLCHFPDKSTAYLTQALSPLQKNT